MPRPKQTLQVICDINTKRYLSTKEAMAYLDVSANTLENWRTEGVMIKQNVAGRLKDKILQLPYYKAGKGTSMIRYKRTEIDSFIEQAFKVAN
ncbi:helix-turn-helix domain-containing protein [Carboxylicivirga marina]|uniref:Helix-turn-helix domain-containing protein n=1 Tax=Carboxylicivirga marina TaxID=2800988 RepID=A0ABS1HG96_9BACT|nr:helix-turn-helix domain-containing protein [Carboxylicivirga marina]MBK3516678.1 helix-turn-helix domain-containing protein [Carboxylicivirga marina]